MVVLRVIWVIATIASFGLGVATSIRHLLARLPERRRHPAPISEPSPPARAIAAAATSSASCCSASARSSSSRRSPQPTRPVRSNRAVCANDPHRGQAWPCSSCATTRRRARACASDTAPRPRRRLPRRARRSPPARPRGRRRRPRSATKTTEIDTTAAHRARPADTSTCPPLRQSCRPQRAWTQHEEWPTPAARRRGTTPGGRTTSRGRIASPVPFTPFTISVLLIGGGACAAASTTPADAVHFTLAVCLRRR